MRIKVSYTKRVDKNNWAHGSRTVEAETPEEAELLVLGQLLRERKNVLCVSVVRTYKLKEAV